MEDQMSSAWFISIFVIVWGAWAAVVWYQDFYLPRKAKKKDKTK